MSGICTSSGRRVSPVSRIDISVKFVKFINYNAVWVYADYFSSHHKLICFNSSDLFSPVDKD